MGNEQLAMAFGKGFWVLGWVVHFELCSASGMIRELGKEKVFSSNQCLS